MNQVATVLQRSPVMSEQYPGIPFCMSTQKDEDHSQHVCAVQRELQCCTSQNSRIKPLLTQLMVTAHRACIRSSGTGM